MWSVTQLRQAVTTSREVIVARSETRNNHIEWERVLISRFWARPEAVREI